MHRRLFVLVSAISLTTIHGCGGPAAPPFPTAEIPVVPEINPADPASFSRWEASRYNVLRSKIEVVSLACFRDRMTEKGHSGAKPVPLEICDALESGVTAEQRAALQRFTDAESEVYAKARAAIYAEYQKNYSTYKQAWSLGASMFGGEAPDIQTVLPKITKGDELDGIVSFAKVYVFRPKDGVVRIGVLLECPWDEENGMGVVIANGEVERVGDSGVVYLAVSVLALGCRRSRGFISGRA